MPHQYELSNLIAASGNAATSGQSFRNHVTGAVTGAAMRDYFITGSTWGGSTPDPGIDYGDPQTFNGLMNLLFGHARASNILRTGNVVVVTDAGSPYGFTVSATSSVTGASSNTVNVTVGGPYAGDDTAGALGVFDDPGNFTDPGFLHLDGYVSPGTPSYVQCYYQVQFVPDIGSYNEMIVWTFPIKILSHARTTAGIDYEWYNDSGYTSVYNIGAATIGVASAPQDTFSKYMRWRRHEDSPGGSWNNFGLVSAHDNRF